MSRINPYKLFIGSFLPNWLLRLPKLQASSKLVYGRLCQYAGEKGVAFPSIKDMVDELGLSEKTIRRCIDELEGAGLIESERQGCQRTNRYFFLSHPAMKTRSEVTGQNDQVSGQHDRSRAVKVTTPIRGRESEEKRETRAQRLEAFLEGNDHRPWFFWAKHHFKWTEERCQTVFETFRDHWRSAPGQKGVKADWEATWRNWCRRESTFQKSAPQARGQLSVRETTPEKRASDLADVAAFEEYKRLSRKYPRLRTDEVWALVGKSDNEIAAITQTGGAS